MATSLGLLYILGPCAAALITAGLVRAKSPSVRVMLLTKLAALTTLSRWRLPKANDALMRRLFAAPRICEMTANPPTTAAQVSPIFSLVPAEPFNKSFMVLSDMTGSLEERGASSISGLR